MIKSIRGPYTLLIAHKSVGIILVDENQDLTPHKYSKKGAFD